MNVKISLKLSRTSSVLWDQTRTSNSATPAVSAFRRIHIEPTPAISTSHSRSFYFIRIISNFNKSKLSTLVLLKLSIHLAEISLFRKTTRFLLGSKSTVTKIQDMGKHVEKEIGID